MLLGMNPGVRGGYRDYSARATASSAQRAMMGLVWSEKAPLPLAAPRGPVELPSSESELESEPESEPPVTAAPAAPTAAVGEGVDLADEDFAELLGAAAALLRQEASVLFLISIPLDHPSFPSLSSTESEYSTPAAKSTVQVRLLLVWSPRSLMISPHGASDRTRMTL